jgi:hypothetical protein
LSVSTNLQVEGQTRLSSLGFSSSITIGATGDSIAIGNQAGQSNQETNTVAIGYQAGQNFQGNNSVAIGYQAGLSNLRPNSIAINATDSALNPDSSGLFIKPIKRRTTTENPISYPLYYDPSNGEIYYHQP